MPRIEEALERLASATEGLLVDGPGDRELAQAIREAAVHIRTGLLAIAQALHEDEVPAPSRKPRDRDR
jgi:hypothetical protein